MLARMAVGLTAAMIVGACVSAPPAPPAPAPEPVIVAVADPLPAAPFVSAPTVIDSPPIEPVEPPSPAAAQPAALPGPTAQVAVVPPTTAPQPATPAPPPAPPEPSPEEREFTALLADLQRYTTLSSEELRREHQAVNQQLTRTKSDAVRLRLGVLLTLTRQGVQDDQRALQLFDGVAKSNPGPTAVKQLAAVLSVQVAERIRVVKDEQARSEAAIQKLEALRAMERSLLRDRVRSGGGGGGAGSGGN
jgi:hypothetical protein